MSRRPALLAAALVAVSAPGVASAHTTATSSTPAAGARVAKAPKTVTVRFGAQVLSIVSARIVAPGGAVVTSGARISRGNVRHVVIGMTGSRTGRYRVSVSVKGADTHTVSHTFTFRVGAA